MNPYDSGKIGNKSDYHKYDYAQRQEFERGKADQEDRDESFRQTWAKIFSGFKGTLTPPTKEEYQAWRKKFTVKQRQQAAVVSFTSVLVILGLGLYFWYNENPLNALVLFISGILMFIMSLQHRFHKELPPLSSIIDLDFEKVDEVLTKSSHAPDPTKWGEKLPVSVGAIFAIVGVIFSLLTGLILTVGFHSLKFSSTRTKGAFVFLAGAVSLFYIFKLAIKFKDNRNFDKGIHIFFMISLILFEIFALSML